MESDDLKFDPEDAQLRALIHQHVSDPISDDGFSANVLAALPPTQRRTISPRVRDLIVVIAAFVVVIAIQLVWIGSTASLASFSETVSQLSGFFTDRDTLIILAIAAGTLFFLEDSEAPDPL